jgi:ABC-type sulfate transport system permease component
MIATPLVVRMVLPLLRAADERLRQAAAVLGAGPLRVWAGVDLPIMSRALGGATAFALAAGVLLTVACAAVVLVVDLVSSRGGRDSGIGGF